jgi:predicted dienelactone hydrolase
MNIFKYAALKKVRVPTSRGNLSAEQLLDLPINPDLTNVVTNLAKNLDKQVPSTLDFLDESIEVDELTQAQFDLVKEIIKHKQSENKIKTQAAVTRTHNAKIDALIAKKQEEELSTLSIAELAKLKK